ncbi:MAG: hypothetical protein LQ340_002161 [Diploschistes diacapsis]|nr:MAG: hypothetical protein LQ340_002161 [Diploschistes diacapsis]
MPEEIPIGWARWGTQLEDVEERCLTFTEDICRAVAKQHGLEAVNVRWEPHNWSGDATLEKRVPHDWHITADFKAPEGYAKTAHIYTSSGEPEWFALRKADGSIKAIFQDEIANKESCNPWLKNRPRSMPELRRSTKLFELARPRQQTRSRSSNVATTSSWRAQRTPSPQASSRRDQRRNTWPAAGAEKPKKDVMGMATWR